MVFELRHRPAWVVVPVSAVRRMLKGGGSAKEEASNQDSPEDEGATAAAQDQPVATAPSGDPIQVDPDVLQQVSEGRYYQYSEPTWTNTGT